MEHVATLGPMPSNLAHDNVISLASARAQRGGHDGRKNQDSTPAPDTPQHTLLLHASNIQASQEVHRQLGIDASVPLSELHGVLDVVFGTSHQSPWFFTDAHGHKLDPTTCAGHVLGTDDTILYVWGLWHFELHCFDTCPRDTGTPRALCIGGSGGFAIDFDQAAINAELTGTDTIRSVLSHVRPEVVDLVDRTGVFDFIPLLQALELHRETLLSAPTTRTCRTLPREHGAEASDAFWSCILALSCLGDTELFMEVITSTMAALGWVADDGSELGADAITAACAESLGLLSEIHAYGDDLLAPVERLDIYRALLRA